jgi:hypothetical protein
MSIEPHQERPRRFSLTAGLSLIIDRVDRQAKLAGASKPRTQFLPKLADNSSRLYVSLLLHRLQVGEALDFHSVFSAKVGDRCNAP